MNNYHLKRAPGAWFSIANSPSESLNSRNLVERASKVNSQEFKGQDLLVTINNLVACHNRRWVSLTPCKVTAKTARAAKDLIMASGAMGTERCQRRTNAPGAWWNFPAQGRHPSHPAAGERNYKDGAPMPRVSERRASLLCIILCEWRGSLSPLTVKSGGAQPPPPTRCCRELIAPRHTAPGISHSNWRAFASKHKITRC